MCEDMWAILISDNELENMHCVGTMNQLGQNIELESQFESRIQYRLGLHYHPRGKEQRMCRNWWVLGTDHAGAKLAALGPSCIYRPRPLISRKSDNSSCRAPRTPFSMRQNII
jgi:hypothetical protein